MKRLENIKEQEYLRLTIPLGRRSVLAQLLPCVLPHMHFVKIEHLLPTLQTIARMTVVDSQIVPMEPMRLCREFRFTYELQQQLVAVGSFSHSPQRMTVNLKKLSCIGTVFLKTYSSGISTYRLRE